MTMSSEIDLILNQLLAHKAQLDVQTQELLKQQTIEDRALVEFSTVYNLVADNAVTIYRTTNDTRFLEYIIATWQQALTLLPQSECEKRVTLHFKLTLLAKEMNQPEMALSNFVAATELFTQIANPPKRIFYEAQKIFNAAWQGESCAQPLTEALEYVREIFVNDMTGEYIKLETHVANILDSIGALLISEQIPVLIKSKSFQHLEKIINYELKEELKESLLQFETLLGISCAMPNSITRS